MNPDAITPDGFMDALNSGDPIAIIGLSILIVTGALHYILNEKFSVFVDQITSLLRGVATGVGSSLITAAATGGDWKVAVAAGVAGLLLSQGFLDLVRDMIPSKRPNL